MGKSCSSLRRSKAGRRHNHPRPPPCKFLIFMEMHGKARKFVQPNELYVKSCAVRSCWRGFRGEAVGRELAAGLGERKGADGWIGVKRFPKSCQNMAKSHSVVADAGSAGCLSVWRQLSLIFGSECRRSWRAKIGRRSRFGVIRGVCLWCRAADPVQLQVVNRAKIRIARHQRAPSPPRQWRDPIP